MKRLVCEILIPDNADYKTKLDAMAEASRNEALWREVKTREERVAEQMERTDLHNKCGSCMHFKPVKCGRCKAYGMCTKGFVSPRPRSVKACNHYKKRRDS